MTLLYTTDLGSQANNQRNKVYSWDFWLSGLYERSMALPFKAAFTFSVEI